MPGATSVSSMVTALAWLVLAALGLAHLAQVELPFPWVAAAAGVGIPAVLAASASALAAVRRGPRIVEFGRDDAVMCSPEDAPVVRGAAQLRGTMGGAGHLHPRRLVLPATAWAAAAGSGAEALADGALLLGAWPAIVALLAAGLALVFPARPFYYREVTGGGVLASPPAAAAYLLARQPGNANARADGPGICSTG